MVYSGSSVLISSYGARSRRGPMLISGAIRVDDQKSPKMVLALASSN